MTSNNINYPNQNMGGGSSNVPAAQPTEKGLWDNNGVLTYWDGTQNRVLDFDGGMLLDAFGNPTGIDI